MGASLLAIAVGQLASMLDVPASSRAGSFPQGLVLSPDAVGTRNPLLAIAVGLLVVMLDVPASSRASSLPQGLVLNPGAVGICNLLWERACSRKRWVSL
ncbi:hypothetical protein EMIT0P228_60225 [Pseudomonas brassicacearum]